MEPTWTMRDGTKIAIKDMETSHIKNCLKMLERNVCDMRNSVVNMLEEAQEYSEARRIFRMTDKEILELTEHKDLSAELEAREL